MILYDFEFPTYLFSNSTYMSRYPFISFGFYLPVKMSRYPFISFGFYLLVKVSVIWDDEV